MTEITLRYLQNKSLDPQKYGKIVLEPFEPESGLPYANALRRVLLSSIPGKGIIAVRFDNVVHEFSSIPGVRDDVSDIIQNMKKIVWKGDWDKEVKTARLDINGPAEVTAEAISLPFGLSIVNPEQPITSVAAGNRLALEVDVISGRGWSSCEQNKTESAPITTIFIDSQYNPARHVQYHIQPIIIGKKPAERIILEVETDGSIRPDEATCMAARFLKAHIGLLEDFEVGTPKELVAEEDEQKRLNSILEEDVAILCLSNRSKNCLKFTDITTVGELAAKSVNELIELKNFGKKSLNEIREKLAEHGLYLQGDDGWENSDSQGETDEEVDDSNEGGVL